MCWQMERHSVSIPRAVGPVTGGSTVDGPASAGSRWPPAPPWSQSQCSAPTGSSQWVPGCRDSAESPCASGHPLQFYGPPDGGASQARRVVTDEIMAAIQELSRQEMVAGYNELSAVV